MDEPTRIAYEAWRKLQPEDGEACCNLDHWRGKEVRGEFIVGSLQDDLVCERERAWRKYVRLRDGNPFFPF
jgi:hypothetical protein